MLLKQISIIHIFGSSGSGSTTLAKAISQEYGYHFIDTDDAIWEDTDPPFTVKNTEKEEQEYVRKELDKHEKCVISGAFVGWGDIFKDRIDLFIYMHLPLAIRLQRIQIREVNRFGSRVLPGGDLYLQHLDFLNWVSNYEKASADVRGQKQHEAWLKGIDRPLIRINEPMSIEKLLSIVEPYLDVSEK